MSNNSEENNSNKEEDENEESEEDENEEGEENEENEEKASKQESKKSESKKSESKKSESKKSEEKKSESKKSESKKTESKKSESKKSESKKTESKKSESKKSGSKQNEEKKSEQKSSNTKNLVTNTVDNPSEKDKNSTAKKSSGKQSRNSKKIIIDAGKKTSNVATFNEILKSDPDVELNTPSVHYSEKYGKIKKNPRIKSTNLTTFDDLMKNDPNQELNPPSVHYSEKYGKKPIKEEKKVTKEEKKVEEKKSEEKKEQKIEQKIEQKSIDTSELLTFENYIKGDPEMDLAFVNLKYKRYLENEEQEEEIKTLSQKSKKSKQSKQSKHTANTINSKKSKVSSTIYMYQDIIGNPDKQYKIKDIDYNQRYGEQESKKSQKKVKIKEPKPMLGNVAPERVILIDEQEKENLPKLFCCICGKFPLEPSVCSECKSIFCYECIKDKSKCQKCNSIYKHTDLDEELNKLFSLCRIICTYAPCGCKEQLIPKELSNHEEKCKNTNIECENCNEKMTYEIYLPHFNECKLNTAECEVCGYKDNVRQFEKTNKKIEHIRHILMPEIETLVKTEIEKAVIAINDSLDRREANKEPKDDKFEQEMRQKLLDVQQLLLNIQPKEFIDKKDDVGTMTKASYLDRKIKKIKCILTVPSKIDNSFDCNNKYCVIHSFKNDNYIIYPNMKYGINLFNLSLEKDMTVIPNAFESNITCMYSCSNPKKSMTYFAAASYDRSIKIYSIEDGFKKIKTYKEIFNDYSNFALDLYTSNNQLILLAGNENLKRVKVLYPEEDSQNEKSMIKELKCKNKVLCLKHNPTNEEEFFIGTEEGVHLYNIFNLIGEGEDDNKKVEPERDFIDKNEDKAKHVCITFIEEEKNYMIEGDSIGIMRIWSIKDGELRKKITRGILKYQISSLDSWSGRFIIGGTKDGKLVIFDIFDGIAFGEFGEHKGYVYCVKVSENWKYEKIITSCGFDGELKIWASLEN